MTNEAATALTDILLACVSLFFAINLSRVPNKAPWVTLFISVALASAFGALFHGVPALHMPEIWTIVSGTTVMSGFTFLACSISLWKPQSKFLFWLWPLLSALGAILGLVMAGLPFPVLSIPNGLCIAGGAWLLKKSPYPQVRKEIYIGLGLIVIGLVLQQLIPFEGLLYKNAVFHYFQIAGNYFLWRGARHY